MISTNNKRIWETCWSMKDHGKNYHSVFYKKHKLLKSEVSEEANKSELALKLWHLSEELCRSFGFVSLNI